MARMMDDLHQEHVRIARLLDLLDEQIERIGTADTPDLDLMLDIVDYTENYPDLVHHPKEDVIYRTYLAHHQKDRAKVEGLLVEHESLIGMTKSFKDTLCQAINGVMVPAADLKGLAKNYSLKQRHHLDREEGEVFPLLKEGLSDEEWGEIEAKAPDRQDPLFGPEVAQQYQALYRRIVSS
ncbi:MAG: hemerythrin domain-containing protein [Chromatiales bacterium]|nr:hemerythrin domain-containing protein [Chromatiales bacterium]